MKVEIPPGLCPREGAAGSMAGGAECLLHALLGASEDVAAGAHRTAYQHRLPRQLIVNRDLDRSGVVRGFTPMTNT